jgi:hypothetical protein
VGLVGLIFDPMGDLAETVGRVEDVLLFCDPETDEEVVVLDAGAHAAGSLALALRDAAANAPTLIAPDDYSELGPVLRCPLATHYLPAVLRAVGVVPLDELHGRVPGAISALRLIERCLPHDPGPAGIERDQFVREELQWRPDKDIVVPSTPWEDAVAADEAVLLEAWPDQPGTRWVLTFEECAAYIRLRDAVLFDVLDRFTMS